MSMNASSSSSSFRILKLGGGGAEVRLTWCRLKRNVLTYQNTTSIAHKAIKLQKIKWLLRASHIFKEKTGGGA